MNFLRIKLAVIFVISGLWMGQAHAASAANPFQGERQPAYSATMILAKKGGKEVSLERAIKKAKAKYGGKVLSAKEIRSKGPLVYKIKILLPNGRVKSVFVDGTTGDVFEA